MTSRLPLNFIAPVLIAIPVLILGVGLSTLWYWQSRDAVSTLIDQEIDQIHDLVTLKINEIVAIPPMVCLMNEHLMKRGLLDPSDLPSWRETFYQEIQAFKSLSAITWGSEDGRSAWVARYADGKTYWDIKDDPSIQMMREWIIDEVGNITKSPINTFDYDLFSRPWYMTPRKAGRPAWSQPYLWAGAENSENETVGVSYGRPIFNEDGTLIGVMDTDISLNDLSGFLQSIPVGKTGVAILASSDGKLLATSDKSRVVADDGSLSKIAASSNLMIQQIGSALDQQQLTQNYNGTVMLEDEPHLMRLSKAGESVGLDWRLGTIIPESDFLAEIDEQFHRSLTLSLAVLILVFIFGTLTFRWLVNPLHKLIEALRKIGDGQLETKVNIATTSEYVKLGNAINQMTRNLQKSHEREDLLKREHDHRVKNMLTQIVVLCQKTVSQCTTDQKLVENLTARVSNLSGVHDLLAGRNHPGISIEELIKDCSSPYLTSKDLLETEGPGIYLNPKAAMCLSHVINELATNSCKHGAFSRTDGLVNATWRIQEAEDGDMLEINWVETRGKQPAGEMTPSFGTQVIQDLIPYELSGTAEMAFTPEGLDFKASISGKHFKLLKDA